MATISKQSLESYRRGTFRLNPGQTLASKEVAIDYVNERGFIFFWPIKGIDLPSLWTAVAGDRPVPDEHDDPGHITWGWKDELLDKKVWYYARVLRHRNTLISLQALPYFYALSPNYGDPEIDYLDQYQEGALPQEAKLVYEALLQEGALDSVSLRKTAHLAGSESTSRFNKALDILQNEFKILPVRVAQAGAWKYAFVYELTHRFFPDLIEEARPIGEWDARRYLAMCYLNSVGAIQERDLVKLFGWRSMDAQRTLASLQKEGKVLLDAEMENFPGKYAVLPNLVS
jgi:hypothetical protein